MDPAMMAAMITAGATAGSTGASMANQSIKNKKQYKRSRKLMDKQFRKQSKLNEQGYEHSKNMWELTNYPNQVNMLKEAGLNPALLYKNAGGTGGTTGVASGGGAGVGMAQNTSGQRLGLMENAMAMQQIKESNERIENSKSERGKRDGVDTEQGWATIENIMQDTQNKELEEKLTEQKTINMQLQNVTEIDRAEALIKQANANTSKIAQDTSIDAETRKDVVKARMLENLETEARILERKTNVTMSKAQMQNMIDNVLVARQNADANDDKNALEVTRQTLMKELKQMDIDQRWWEMWVKAGSTAIN